MTKEKEKEKVLMPTAEDKKRCMKIREHEENHLMEREKNEKRRSPYRDFIQMNAEEWKRAVLQLSIEYPKAMTVLLFLIVNMDNYNALVCSYRVMEERLEFSTSTIKRAIKHLKEHGFISVYRSGSAYVYAINPVLVWRSYGSNIKYAKFPANILLTSSENAEYEKEDSIISERTKTLQLKEKGGRS